MVRSHEEQECKEFGYIIRPCHWEFPDGKERLIFDDRRVLCEAYNLAKSTNYPVFVNFLDSESRRLLGVGIKELVAEWEKKKLEEDDNGDQKGLGDAE